jgi:GNAT superfamily N-acetyltransferase
MATKRFTPIISTRKQDLRPSELVKLWISVGWATKKDNYPAPTVKAAINNTSCVVTARNEDRDLIGIARLYGDGIYTMYIGELIIHPDYQGKGVGRKILDKVKEKYKHTEIALFTGDHNRKFYRKCGFKDEGYLVFFAK